LLDEVVDAFAAGDAAAAFTAVDRVVQTGQDPRRFVDDLLERLRDLIVVAATGKGAAAVLRGVSDEDLARMIDQAGAFGTTRLSRTADLVVAALDEMTGATSPRLQLELMVARVLAQGGAGASVGAPAVARAAETIAAPAAATASAAPAAQATAVADSAEAPRAQAAAPAPASPPPASPPAAPAAPVTLARFHEAWPAVLARLETISRPSWLLASGARVIDLAGDVLTLSFQSQSDVAKFKKLAAGAGPSEDLRQAIQAVLGIRIKYLAKHESEPGPTAPSTGGATPSPSAGPAPQVPPARPATAPSSGPSAAEPVTEWAVASIPSDSDAPPADAPESPSAVAQFAVDDEPEDATGVTRVQVATLATPREGDVLPASDIEPSVESDDEDAEMDAGADLPVPPVVAPPMQSAAARSAPSGPQRYGEAVVRQVLGARFVREEPYQPPTRFS
ncbi:MAG TPA: DNA polymerase III subunit gamma and tau, partial [Microbacterium sp.]|nr:DNA polymerase III subunit gamma and tau [Microbacterium sp.]